MSVEKPVSAALNRSLTERRDARGCSCLGTSVAPSGSSFLLSQMLLQTLWATVHPVTFCHASFWLP